MWNFLFSIYLKVESIPPKIAKTNIKPYKEIIIKVNIPKNLWCDFKFSKPSVKSCLFFECKAALVLVAYWYKY